jgi:hypothetical protein
VEQREEQRAGSAAAPGASAPGAASSQPPAEPAAQQGAASPPPQPQQEGHPAAAAATATTAAPAAAAGSQGQLVKAEQRQLGAVDSSVYRGYAAAIGWPTCAAILLAFLSGQTLMTMTDFWLSSWARAAPEEQGQARWLWVYAAMTGGVGGGRGGLLRRALARSGRAA